MVTRAVGQADELICQLKELGAEVVHILTIEIVPPDSWAACDTAIENLQQYHWVIFTSTNGVRFFIQRLQEKGNDVEELRTKQIAAVGERTKADLENKGIGVDLVPEQFRAEGLLEAFSRINMQRQVILLPKAQKSRDILITNLSHLGARVDAVPVYKNQLPDQSNFSKFQKVLNGQSVGVLTFTSPSTVRNFITMFGEKKIAEWCANGSKIAAIGGVTEEALNEYNLRPDIIPKKSTISSLAEAIEEFFA